MEAGLLSAVLGIILLQVEMTTQDLDLQKVAFFLGPGRRWGGEGPTCAATPGPPSAPADAGQLHRGPRTHPGQPREGRWRSIPSPSEWV